MDMLLLLGYLCMQFERRDEDSWSRGAYGDWGDRC